MVAGTAAAVVTSPSAAAVTGAGFRSNVGTATTTESDGGPPTVEGASTDALGSVDTTTITVNSSRTVINWSSFTLAGEDVLNVVFARNDPGDVVVFRVDRDASIGGTLTTFLGGVGGRRGGNVWFTTGSGVFFGPSALVDAGGLLATTGALSDADVLDGDGAFSPVDAPATSQVLIGAGAQIRGRGGLVGFLAPSVSQGAKSTIRGEEPSTEVLFGAARTFSLSLGRDSSGGNELLGLSVPTGAGSPSGLPIHVTGTVAASDVYVAPVSSGPVGAIVDGTMTATGALANGSGTVLLSAAGGIARTAIGQQVLWQPAGPSPAVNGFTVHGSLSAPSGSVAVVTPGSVALGPSAQASAPTVVVSTGGEFANGSGDDVFSAAKWMVYAPAPTSISLGPDSGRTAFWGSTIHSRPPSAVAESRYVFAERATLVFTSADAAKVFDEPAAPLPFTVSGYRDGVPGVFAGDTAATAYTGTPALASEGTTGREGAYPITIAPGTVASPAGYALSFVGDGELTVDDTSPPLITGVRTGTAGNTPWLTGDGALDWTVTELGSTVSSSAGCDDLPITVDTPVTAHTCTATSGGGSASLTVEAGRDSTPPVLTVPADRTVPTSGTSAAVAWPATTATDNLTAAPATSCAPPSGSTFSLGRTTVRCTASDAAGNTTTRSFNVTVGTPSVAFDRPIDAAPVMNIAKLGRVIPVKATVTVDGQPLTSASAEPVSLRVLGATSCTAAATTDDIEVYAAGSSSTGNLMRWDAAGGRWTYNLDTSSFGMKANSCYRVDVYAGGTVSEGTASGGSLAGSFFVQAKK